jgi:hypothetical protein
LLQVERQRLGKEWEQEQEAKMQLMMPVSFVFYEGKGSTNHYEARELVSLRMFAAVVVCVCHTAPPGEYPEGVDSCAVPRPRAHGDSKGFQRAPKRSRGKPSVRALARSLSRHIKIILLHPRRDNS